MENDKEKDRYRIKEKKDKFSWTADDFKIVFSNPSIEPVDDYGHVEGPDDFRFFYYTMKTYTRNRMKKKGWKEISSVEAYDFPMLLQLKYMLERVLGDIPYEECRKIQYYFRDEPAGTGYDWIGTTEGFACDDWYEVGKTVIMDVDSETRERFSLYAGCSTDPQGGQVSVGVRLDYVDRKGIELLLECVESFLGYMIRKHNDETLKNINDCRRVYAPSEGRLYKKDMDEHSEDMFIKGDVLSNIIMIKYTDKENYRSECYSNTTITEIKDEFLKVQGGTVSVGGSCRIEKADGETTIPIDRIIYVSRMLDYDKVKEMDAAHIINDFPSRLTLVERDELSTKNIRFLIQKWGKILESTYFMHFDNHKRFGNTDINNIVESVMTQMCHTSDGIRLDSFLDARSEICV